VPTEQPPAPTDAPAVVTPVQESATATVPAPTTDPALTPTPAAPVAGWSVIEWEGLRVPVPPAYITDTTVQASGAANGFPILASLTLTPISGATPGEEGIQQPAALSLVVVEFTGGAQRWLDTLFPSGTAAEAAGIQPTTVAGLPALAFAPFLPGPGKPLTHLVELAPDKLLIIQSDAGAGDAQQAIAGLALSEGGMSSESTATPRPPASAQRGEVAYLLNGTIYLLDLVTGERQPVTVGDLRANELAWAPDGQRLAFSAGADTSDIYTIDVDGGDLVRVTDSPAHEAFPAYAPDGTLRFLRHVRDLEHPTIDIVRWAADGAETVVHSEPGGLCGATGLRWGSETAFALALNCGRGSYVLLGDLETGETKDFGATNFAGEMLCAYQAAWPWRERRLVVATSRECAPHQQSELLIVNLDAGAERATPLYRNARIGAFDWSPEGKAVVFSQGSEAGDGATELWLLDLAQTEPERIGEGAYPAWRPASSMTP